MNGKITVELDDAILAALGRRATAHGRSPAAEAEDIVRRDCAPFVDRGDFLEGVRETARPDTGRPFDREAFLRRARELATRSRSQRLKHTGGRER